MEIRGLERAKDDMVVEQVGKCQCVCAGGSGTDCCWGAQDQTDQPRVVMEKGEGVGAGSDLGHALSAGASALHTLPTVLLRRPS